jgi:hypothetical protein
MNKKYVKVSADIDENGKKTPRTIVYNDEAFEIDKVLEVKNCASFKVGGIGERYTIRVRGKTTYIYFENGRWFVEEK